MWLPLLSRAAAAAAPIQVLRRALVTVAAQVPMLPRVAAINAAAKTVASKPLLPTAVKAALPPAPTLQRNSHTAFKTKSAAKKRFRLTGQGHFKRAKAGRNHINVNKGRKRLREAGKSTLVTPAQEKTLYKLLLHSH